MKKIICILLAVCTLMCCTACGQTSYGIRTIETLVEQEYSLAFRNDDTMYFYVTGALKVLAANGTVDELTRKWFGEQITSFDKDAAALDALGEIAPHTLLVGVDENAFPMSYLSDGRYWGFDIELANAVAELLGWDIMFQSIEKEEVYIELYSGNIDVAWGGIALSEKELAAGKYTQYGPYIHNDIVVAARDSSSVWNKMKLNGRNMTMPTTQEAADALAADPKLGKRLGQITRLAGGTPECFEYLYSGKCDAVLTDSTAIYYFNCH